MTLGSAMVSKIWLQKYKQWKKKIDNWTSSTQEEPNPSNTTWVSVEGDLSSVKLYDTSNYSWGLNCSPVRGPAPEEPVNCPRNSDPGDRYLLF